MHVKHVTDATFEQEVLQSSTPVLVDFWAGWCPPCRAMAPVLDEYAAENDGRIKVVKIDADENPVMTGKYRIRSLPTMMLFKQGASVGSIIGYMPKQDLAREIEAKLSK